MVSQQDAKMVGRVWGKEAKKIGFSDRLQIRGKVATRREMSNCKFWRKSALCDRGKKTSGGKKTFGNYFRWDAGSGKRNHVKADNRRLQS
jgi:hypothetical protein